jgi:chemotaxis protein histidine kinase CheA
MATNNTTVAITISADTQPAETSVKSFKTQLREANGELVAMSEKFGAASTEAVAAAKKVAGLKDAIGDAKALAETFNPDKKFVALGGAIQGAVSGFSALQGASALFGGESKELEKTLLKVQSAMALQQGISGVFNALDSFKLLGAEIKGNVVKAFTGLKAAIGATGIGLLAVALGVLVANFDKVKVVIEKLLGPLASVGKFIGGLVDRITDFIGVTSDASRELAKMREEADKSLTLNNKYLAQHGDQLDKYTKAKIEAKNRYLEAVKDEKNSEADRLEFAKRMNREIAAADKERSDDAAKAQAEAAKKAADKQKEIDDKRKADLKSQQDALRNIINKTQQDIENDADKTEAQKLDRQRQRDIKELDAIKLSTKEKREALDLINKKYDILNTELEIKTKEEKDKKDKEDAEKKATALKEQGDRLIAAELLRIKTIQDAQKAAAEEQKRIDEEAAKNKEIVLSTVSNLGNRFADIVGRQTIAGKALAIASATIDTYQAANSALKANYGPFGPAAAIARFVSVAATIAAGIKNVKTIASTQVPGGGGGGGSVPTPSIPTAPVLPQASSTTINQGQINQIGNVAARAFVVESDVSGNQERIQRLNRAARIN